MYELSSGRQVEAQPDAGVPDPAELAEELESALERLREAERERGMTLAGPHRDDVVLHLGELPAKGYASHGEQWSLTLALRLASGAVIADVGEDPIVLLDDVFAELDAERRQRLAARCAGFGQVLVTAAVDDDVPLDGPRLYVTGGAVDAMTRRSGEPRPAPVALAAVLGELTARRRWAQRLDDARIVDRWEEIVGPTVASKTRVVRLAGGVLVVRGRRPGLGDAGALPARPRSWPARTAVLGAGRVRAVHVVHRPAGSPAKRL